MHLSKREFEVLSLYKAGLTFREVGLCLHIAERTAINFFVRARNKDKPRARRAKQSRTTHKDSYKMSLKEVMLDVKRYNRNEYCTTKISLDDAKRNHRLNYMSDALVSAFREWNRYKLKNAKKYQ